MLCPASGDLVADNQSNRTCIGKNMSMMEIGKVIPQLLREFEVELLNDWKVNNAWFVQQTGLNVKLRKRARQH